MWHIGSFDPDGFKSSHSFTTQLHFTIQSSIFFFRALNLNCLFCPFPLCLSLVCGVREGHRLWALNYPCSTLALNPPEHCGWTDFMRAMMVWRGVILFHWFPPVHLLHLHPSSTPLTISSLHSDTNTCRYTNKSMQIHMHAYCTYAEHSVD